MTSTIAVRLAVWLGIAAAVWEFLYGNRNLQLQTDRVDTYYTLNGPAFVVVAIFEGVLVAIFAWIALSAVAFIWRRIRTATSGARKAR